MPGTFFGVLGESGSLGVLVFLMQNSAFEGLLAVVLMKFGVVTRDP